MVGRRDSRRGRFAAAAALAKFLYSFTQPWLDRLSTVLRFFRPDSAWFTTFLCSFGLL